MRLLAFITTLLFIGVALAQAQKPPAATPTPNFCDVTYSVETETTLDNDDVNSSSITIRAMPYADVQEDHARQLKILDVISKEQNKGGPYTVTVTETNTCDGGNTVRISSGSIYAEGITLAGSTRI